MGGPDDIAPVTGSTAATAGGGEIELTFVAPDVLGGTVLEWGKSFSDIKNLVDQVAERCKRGDCIKHLNIVAHGADKTDGFVGFDNEGAGLELIDGASKDPLHPPGASPAVREQLERLRKYLCPGAIIEFRTCHFGTGDHGTRAMQAVADATGATVTAPMDSIQGTAIGGLFTDWKTVYPSARGQKPVVSFWRGVDPPQSPQVAVRGGPPVTSPDPQPLPAPAVPSTAPALGGNSGDASGGPPREPHEESVDGQQMTPATPPEESAPGAAGDGAGHDDGGAVDPKSYLESSKAAGDRVAAAGVKHLAQQRAVREEVWHGLLDFLAGNKTFSALIGAVALVALIAISFTAFAVRPTAGKPAATPTPTSTVQPKAAATPTAAVHASLQRLDWTFPVTADVCHQPTPITATIVVVGAPEGTVVVANVTGTNLNDQLSGQIDEAGTLTHSYTIEGAGSWTITVVSIGSQGVSGPNTSATSSAKCAG